MTASRWSASSGSTNRSSAVAPRQPARNRADRRRTPTPWRRQLWQLRLSFNIPAAQRATWQQRRRQLQRRLPDTGHIPPRVGDEPTTTTTRSTTTTLKDGPRRRRLRRRGDRRRRKSTRKTLPGFLLPDRRSLFRQEQADRWIVL